MPDIDKIIQQVEGTLAVDGLKASEITKKITKEFLKGKINSENAVESIKRYHLKKNKSNEPKKEKTSIKLYLQGMNETSICKKLHIVKKELSGYIKKNCTDIRKTAILMYFNSCSKKFICDKLNIPLAVIEIWIEQEYREENFYKNPEKQEIENKVPFTLFQIQEGKLPWVSEILLKHWKSIKLAREEKFLMIKEELTGGEKNEESVDNC